MNCPHCQKELPPNYDAAWCPVCGKDLQPAPQPVGPLPPVKLNTLIFFSVFLAPLLLTILAVILGSNDSHSAVSGTIAFFGGCAAGVYCGITLARAMTTTIGNRVALCVAFSIVLSVAIVTMDCVGCMASGYNLNFH
jgi:hypothetical protein